MEVSVFVELIASVGFPIACVIALGAFVFVIYKKWNEDNAKLLEQAQTRCQAREDKLYEEIKECREINGQAIATIAKYADKLEAMQKDIADIKTDIVVISNKIN